MMKRIWAALALATAAIGLSSCGEAEEQVAAGPEVTNARLMLPAVAGNPGAVYFDVKNDSDRNLMIRAVAVAGAGSAEMHNEEMAMVLQMAVPPKASTAFEPGGRHIMAMKLADTVVAGGQAEVTLTFVGGDKLSFPAEVRAAGDER